VAQAIGILAWIHSHPGSVVRGALLAISNSHRTGSVLDDLNLPLGVVEALRGRRKRAYPFAGRQSRWHDAMHLRHDAVPALAEWILAVEQEARATPGLVRLWQSGSASGASNVIAGELLPAWTFATRPTRSDQAVNRSFRGPKLSAPRPGIRMLQQQDRGRRLRCGFVLAMQKALRTPVFGACMISGAGHDAMILAQKMPMAMLFLRSPAGLAIIRTKAFFWDVAALANWTAFP